MFDDSQTNQGQGTGEITDNGAAALGIGVNPSPALTDNGASDAPTSAPQVVLPSQPADDDTSTPAAAATDPAPVAASGELDDIKRQALAQLSPLVNKLDQPPVEKFKTLMMMIQAADNQDLINEAYQTAQAITDEKAKAEALLNVVNEINYFTQQKPQNNS